MAMKRLGVALFTLVAGTAVWASATGGAVATAPLCGSAHAKILLRSNGVRVYSMPNNSIFGCIEASGVTKRLSPIRPGNRPPYFLGRPFAADAPWVVAFSSHNRSGERFGPAEGFAVTARNLALGDVSACHLHASKQDVYPTVVEKLAIARNGDFAWSGTREHETQSGPGVTRVVVACIPGDLRGMEMTAASSTDISIGSLALRGKTLEWEEAGAHCSVRLERYDPALSSHVSCD
jgi:hypothetical protein